MNIKKSLFLLWAALCIAFFVNFAGQVSFVHLTRLGTLQFLISKLSKTELMGFGINLFRSLAGIVAFSFACTSLGALTTRAFKLETILKPMTSLTMLTLLGTVYLVGQGIFSLIFLTLSGLYKLTPTYTIFILLTGTLLGLGQLRKFLVLSFDKNIEFGATLRDNTNKIVFGLSISILFFSLLYSSARLSYDSVAVYFSDAKLTALENHVQYFTNDSFVVSVFQTAIQFTALIQVFGDQTARMFSWVSGVLIILFSLAIGERLGMSKRAKLILFVFLLTSTSFLDLLGDGKVDLQSSVPAIAAIFWMITEDQDDMPKYILILIGFFIGLSIVARPYNAILLGVFPILFYSNKFLNQKHYRNSKYKLLITTLAWICIGIIPLGIYHLFANWIILGDPLAPLSNALRANSSRWQWAFDPKYIWLIRLFYPFVITFINSPQSLGNISPLFVALLPGIIIRSIRSNITISKKLIVLVIISSITLIIWILLFFTVLEIRYVLFLWVILFMPVAEIGATILEDGNQLLRRSTHLFIVLLLAFTLFRVIFISLDAYSPIDNQGNPQCYDSRFCEFLRPINKLAATGDRILTLNAFRYYLRQDLFACSTEADEYGILQDLSYNNDETFWEEIYRQGYKYITYENDYTTRHLQFDIIPSQDNAPNWIKLEPIFGKPGDLYIAYKINVVDPPVHVEKICQKNSSGTWEVRSIAP